MNIRLDLESALIGAVMRRALILDEIQVLPGVFYWPPHQQLWQSMLDLLAQGVQMFDAITLAQHMEKAGHPEIEGSTVAYLAKLESEALGTYNAPRWAAELQDLSAKRRLSTVLDSGLNLLAAPETTAADITAQLEAMLQAVQPQDLELPLAHSRVYARESLDRLEQRMEGKETGTPTGLVDLDRQLHGLQPQDLVLLAARPSMGKTALALNIAEHVAFRERLPVVVFSLEMGGFQCTDRFYVSHGRLDGERYRSGALTDEDWDKISHTTRAVEESELYIDETGGLPLHHLAARARHLHRKLGKLGLIVVDYLQLMTGTGENRQQEVSNISRGLKQLAKELNCPLLALSQLNRALENRPNKRPVMSDLRDSGGLEQDADVILALYRDAVYNEDTPEPNLAECIILKQRNGPIGTVRLHYTGTFMRFDNYIAGVDTPTPLKDRYAQRPRNRLDVD